MALPAYTDIAAEPGFKELPDDKKAELTEKYWSAFAEENPDAGDYVAGQKDLANKFLASRAERDSASPLKRRFVEREIEDTAFMLRLNEGVQRGVVPFEDAQVELDRYREGTKDRDAKLKKTASLFDPETSEGMAPAFQALRDMALRGGVFGSPALDGRISDVLPGGQGGIVKGSKEAYESIRKTVAEDFHLTNEEVDDVIKHQLDLQPEAVSRDAFGTPHIKAEILGQGEAATADAINKSNLPQSEKDKLLEGLPEKLAGFRKSTVEGVRKNSPDLARELGITEGDTDAAFTTLTNSLNKTRGEQFAGGAAIGVIESMNQVGPPAISRGIEKLQRAIGVDDSVIQEQRQMSGAGSPDLAKAYDSMNRLSSEFNRSKTEIFGTDAASFGSGAVSVGKAVGIGYMTGGLAPFSAARIASMGGAGRALATGINGAVATAPAAAVFGAESGMQTYDAARAAGMSDEEAAKLGWKSAMIEFGVTTAFGALPGLGGVESVGGQLTRATARNAVREEAKNTFKTFGGKLFKGLAGEQFEEGMITALDSAMVQAKINPNMTVDDFKKSMRDTALVTLGVSAGPVAVGSFAESRTSPTYERTTDQLQVDANLRLADDVLPPTPENDGTRIDDSQTELPDLGGVSGSVGPAALEAPAAVEAAEETGAPGQAETLPLTDETGATLPAVGDPTTPAPEVAAPETPGDPAAGETAGTVEDVPLEVESPPTGTTNENEEGQRQGRQEVLTPEGDVGATDVIPELSVPDLAEGYGEWVRDAGRKALPKGSEVEQAALAFELKSEISKENGKDGVQPWQHPIIAKRIAEEVIRGERPDIKMRAVERALGDEISAWELGGKFDNLPVSVAAVEAYNAKQESEYRKVKLPEGYERKGNFYVHPDGPQPETSEVKEADPRAAGGIPAGDAGTRSSSKSVPPGNVSVKEAAYSRDSLKEAFNLDDDQATAADALVQALGLDTSAIRVKKGGTPGQGLAEGEGITLKQGKSKVKGSFEVLADGDALIRGLTNADVSTALHEVSHVARRQLLTRGNEIPGIAPEDIEVAEQWAGAKDGVWSREAEEKFARGFESYLRDGTAPTPELANVFSRIGEWMKSIYKTVKGTSLDVKISPEMRAVLDKLVSRKTATPNLGETRSKSGDSSATPGSPDSSTVPADLTGANQQKPSSPAPAPDPGKTPAEKPAAPKKPEPPKAEESPAPEPEGERPIEVRHRYTEARREELGLPPRAEEPTYTVQGAIDAADAEIARNPDAGKALVKSLQAKQRAISPQELSLLNHEMVTRELKVERTTEALEKATDENRLQLLAESDLAVQELTELMGVLEATRSASGASLGAGANLARNRDYSRAYLLATTSRDLNDGGPVTEKQRQEIDAFIKKNAELEDTIKRLEAERDALAANGATRAGQIQKKLEKDIEKATAKISTKEKREALRTKLDAQAEAARARIAARGKALFQEDEETVLRSGLAPEDLESIKDYAIIAASYFGKGVLNLADLTTKMVEAFGEGIRPFMPAIHGSAVKSYLDAANDVGSAKTPTDVLAGMTPGEVPSRRDVYSLAKAHIIAGLRGTAVLDAVTSDLQAIVPGIDRDTVATIFTDYGKTIYPSQEELAVQLRKVRAAEQVALKLQDVLKGKAPLRTGYQRGDTDPEVRKLQKELNAAMRAAGIKTTSSKQQIKSSLDSARTRMQNEMEDRRKAIADKTPLPGRVPPNYTDAEKAELAKLQTELDQVRADYDAAFTKPGLTDKQRLQIIEKSLSRRIAEEEKMLAEGINSRVREAQMTPWSPKLADLKKRLDSLREARAARREAGKPVKSEFEREVEQHEKRLQRLIAEEEKLVAEGKVARDTKSRTSSVWTPELADLQKKLDALRESRAQARAALNPKKDEAAAAVERAEKALQKSVDRMNDILKTGKLPGPNTDPKPWSPAIATLIKERGRLQDAVKALRKSLAPAPKTKEEKAVAAAIRALDKSIDELNRRITTGDLSLTAKRPDLAGRDPRVAAMRKQRDNLRETLDFLRKVTTPPVDPLQRKIDQIRKATIARSLKLRDRIRRKDFTVAPKPDRLETPALKRARLQEFQLKRRWNEGRLEQMLANRTKLQKIKDGAIDLTFHLQRAIMTSIDVGGFGRQGGVATLSRPELIPKTFAKNFAFTENAADKAQLELERDPMFKAAKEAKLALTEWRPGHKLHEMEEVYRSRYAKKIPGIAQSERSYVTYLNAVRFAYFKLLSDGVDPNDKATLKELAKHVNTFTGRGDLGKFENTAAGLAALLFSPKYWWSRLQIIGNTIRLPFDVATGFRAYRPEIRQARKAIAWEYARMLGGYAAVYSLLGFALKMLPDDEEPYKIGTDPTSSDFGKVVFKNNTRVDFLSGLAQNIVFLERMRQGKKTRIDGSEIKLTGPDKSFGQGRLQLLFDMVRSKAAPVPGAIANMLAEQTVSGQKVFPETEIAGLYMPISAAETINGYKELGVGAGTAAAISNAFGYGVSSYGEGVKDSDVRQDLFTGLHWLSGGKFGYPPSRYQKGSGGSLKPTRPKPVKPSSLKPAKP